MQIIGENIYDLHQDTTVTEYIPLINHDMSLFNHKHVHDFQ